MIDFMCGWVLISATLSYLAFAVAITTIGNAHGQLGWCYGGVSILFSPLVGGLALLSDIYLRNKNCPQCAAINNYRASICKCCGSEMKEHNEDN